MHPLAFHSWRDDDNEREGKKKRGNWYILPIVTSPFVGSRSKSSRCFVINEVLKTLLYHGAWLWGGGGGEVQGEGKVLRVRETRYGGEREGEDRTSKDEREVLFWLKEVEGVKGEWLRWEEERERWKGERDGVEWEGKEVEWEGDEGEMEGVMLSVRRSEKIKEGWGNVRCVSDW